MSISRYENDENQFARINAKLKYISVSKYECDWNSIPHTHGFTEIFYILKGNGGFHVDKNTLHIKENDLVIINPNNEHTEFSLGDKPLEYIVIGIDGLSFHSNEEQPTDSCYVYDYTAHRGEVLFYLRGILKEFQSGDQFSYVLYNNLFEILMITILRKSNVNVVPHISSDSENKDCFLVKRYIDANFKHNITLDDLAKVAHINKYYLIHSFKKSYGVSPINYLINKRIDEGKHLLKTTNYSLAAISRIVGFSSPTYFSKVFKKITALSPNEFRKG